MSKINYKMQMIFVLMINFNLCCQSGEGGWVEPTRFHLLDFNSFYKLDGSRFNGPSEAYNENEVRVKYVTKLQVS